MHYGNIKKTDIANGDGVRVSLFVSGCRNHCAGCFQSETWDFHFGVEFTKQTESEIIEALRPSYIAGLTVLGGEPFEEENQRVLAPFLRRVKETFPKKTIWCYTGYILERDLIGEGAKKQCEATGEMLKYIDILVDGPFIESQKNISLKFRGSENQRILNLREILPLV